jgi:Ca-activated chloride channel homolog
MEYWTSNIWFSLSRWSEFTWSRAWLFYFLPLVPVFFILRYYLRKNSKQGMPMAFVGAKIRGQWFSFLRFLAPVLLSISLFLLITALARPMLQMKSQRRVSEGIDIMLAVDVSESMYIKDIQPNRLEAAKKIIESFVNTRFQDRVGLVAFSGEAITLSPLTTDYQTISMYLDEITPGLPTTDGTALGNAIAVAVKRLERAVSATKILILLSDGDNTAGSIDPQTAAKLAAIYGVKIYTIYIGQQVKPDQKTNEFNNSTDTSQMKNIAKLTGGVYFTANNYKQLQVTFAQINKLEKVKYLESSSNILIDAYHVYLCWGIVFLLLTFFTKVTFLGNILED